MVDSNLGWTLSVGSKLCVTAVRHFFLHRWGRIWPTSEPTNFLDVQANRVKLSQGLLSAMLGLLALSGSLAEFGWARIDQAVLH